MSHANPLYQRLYEELRSVLVGGAYQEGEQFPTERQLAERYGVGRMTVRRAVERLCGEGYLEKIQGSGTYVRRPSPPERFRQGEGVRSFCDVCAGRGVAPGARTVARDVMRPRPDERAFFGMDPHDLVLYLRRVRTADGVPLFDENASVPYAGFERLLSRELDDASLFSALLEVGGRAPVGLGNRVVEAVAATRSQAGLLHVDPGAPLLKVTSYLTDESGAPLLVTRNYCVGTRYYLV